MRHSVLAAALIAASILGTTSCSERPQPGSFAPASPESAAPASPPEAAPAGSYDLVLTAAGARKIEVIKAVRAITDLGLRDAKDLVDGAPSSLKAGLTREEADRLAAALEAAGAEFEIRAAPK